MTAYPLRGLNNSIAILFNEGVAHGSIDWIQGEELQFQAAAKMRENDVVEMRMELTGWSDTLYGVLRILQQIQSPEGDAPRFLATMVRMEEKELALLNQWLHECARDGTGQDSSQNVKASLSTLRLHTGLGTPDAMASVIERYENRKGRLRKDTNIHRDPFGLGKDEALKPPHPSPPSTQPKATSGYLKAMEKRRQARRRVDSRPPSNEPFPPPPPSALSRQEKSEPEEDNFFPPPPPAALSRQEKPEPEEDDFFPPPPPAALSRQEKPEPEEDDFFPPPPPTALSRREAVAPPDPVPTGQPELDLDDGTLTLTWTDSASYQLVLPDLLKGSISVPDPGGEVLRIKLKLPNQTELALRLKSHAVVGERLELVIRLNMVLSNKLRSAVN